MSPEEVLQKVEYWKRFNTDCQHRSGRFVSMWQEKKKEIAQSTSTVAALHQRQQRKQR